jgi:hypothetical protein
LNEDLAELWLLVGTSHRLGVSKSVTVVKFDFDVVVRSASVQAAALDAGHIRHDFQFSVQRGSAATAKPVLVDLSRRANGIVIFRGALRDLEVGTRNYDI